MSNRYSPLANRSGWLSSGSELFLEDWALLIDPLSVRRHPEICPMLHRQQYLFIEMVCHKIPWYP